MLERMSTQIKLILFTLILSCFTAVVGFYGVHGLKEIKNGIDEAFDKDFRGINIVSEVEADFLKITSYGLALAGSSSHEDLVSIQDRLTVSQSQLIKDLASLKSTAITDRGRQLMSQLEQALAEWKSVQDNIGKLSWINTDESNAKAVDTAIHDGQAKADSVGKLIAEYTSYKYDHAQQTRKNIEETSSNFNFIATILTSVGVIVGIILGLILAKTTMKQLGDEPGSLSKIAMQIASGDIGVRFDENRPELGVFGAMKKMVAMLKSKIDEAEAKSQEAAKEAQAAREATLLADEATKKAERAKADGMLQAAQQLESIVEIVTSASEQLSAQIEQSSHGAEEQSRHFGETAASMEEMNATVLEVAKNASNAAGTADQAKINAIDGANVVSQVVQGIEQVQHQSQEMKHDMGTLGKQAEGIGQILNVISDIADQTNLLALNAAIEAARAGEAGRGFAVVADEVRKLAEKTMTATKEVGQAIRGIQDGTKKNIDNVERSGKTIEEVTKLANSSGESLKKIVSLAEVTTDQVRSIATASEEQSSASEEINRNLVNVTQISSETADAMRQSAQAVSELANQAQTLKRLIDEMKSEGGEASMAGLPSSKKRLALGRA